LFMLNVIRLIIDQIKLYKQYLNEFKAIILN